MAQKKWSKEDDAKLLSLFKSKQIDPDITDLQSVKRAHQRHFPEREYKNFGPLFRKKCAEFNLTQDLNGARKRCK